MSGKKARGPRPPQESIRRELAELVADPRYRTDESFKSHVRQQFKRVFNDPTGKPGGLWVGRQRIFASELEPFAPVTPIATASAAAVSLDDRAASTGGPESEKIVQA